MSAEFIVKVCGVTSVDDARAAVDAGANAIGLNFHPPSPRCITVFQAAEIAAALPARVLRVGVFVRTRVEEIFAIAAAVPLDILQLHSPATILPRSALFKIWRAIHIRNGAPAEAFGDADAYLLDSASPGSGHTFDWNSARSFAHPMIVAGGLDGSNVADAIATLQPCGVDACSRLESSPGKKDPQRVRAFADAAWAAASRQKLVTL